MNCEFTVDSQKLHQYQKLDMTEFKTEEDCFQHLAKKRWGPKPLCPHCGSRLNFFRPRKTFRCIGTGCNRMISVTKGTAFERHHLPLVTILNAGIIAAEHPNSFKPKVIRRDLKIGSPNTAYNLVHFWNSYRFKEYKQTFPYAKSEPPTYRNRMSFEKLLTYALNSCASTV